MDIDELNNAAIDERFKLLSHSGNLTLHACPRLWELYRLNVVDEDQQEDDSSSMNFAFGHAVGDGIAMVLQGMELNSIIFKLFLDWNIDLEAVNPKMKKGFFYAVSAVQKFHSLYSNNILLSGYELVWLDGIPAVEVGFKIIFPGGFTYRGHIDAVLRHKETNQILVLENKTTRYKDPNPAMYKNSSQAIGYSIILDLIFGKLSSYDVLYLIYKSTEFEYVQFPFTKTHNQRAQWIEELLLDIETIEMYSKANYFPMRGESCVRFGRECEYFNVCQMSTSFLVKNKGQLAREDNREYMYEVHIKDLIESQLGEL